MNKQELINYLNDFLKIKDFKDGSKNGLQIDTLKNEIKKIGYAVDANTYIFDKAIKEKVDLLIVHHGLFWGFESTLTGVPFLRASKFIKNDIGLYGCHLPLDAHKEVGNNWGLSDLFLKYLGNSIKYEKLDFCEYHGNIIGIRINFSEKIELNSLLKFLDSVGIQKDLYNFGNLENFNSIGIVSGGGGEEILNLLGQDLDIYLTGEAAHFQLTYAKEIKQTVILGGHYETETVGVKLLAKHLEEKFSIETVFIDEKY